MNYGFIISIVGLGLAGFAIWMHEPWPASIRGGGTLVALARAFIVGKNLMIKRAKKKSGNLEQ